MQGGAVHSLVQVALASLALGCTAEGSGSRSAPPRDGGDEAADATSTGEPRDAAPVDGSLGDSPRDSRGDSSVPADGESSDASLDAGEDGAGEGGSPDAAPDAPLLLSQTGLFAGIASDGGLAIAAGIESYQPKYPLWSDGADKQRWVYVPPGTTIDTRNPDHWSFPVGTKFWKEFALAGQRIETRLVWRFGPGAGDFLYAAYHWQLAADGGPATDAVAVSPRSIVGVQDANGTSHDIPPVTDCVRCHGREPEHVLGFGAIQLSHSLPGLTLSQVNAKGWTSPPLADDYPIPGTTLEQDALGYLHGNCGNCHNDVPGLVGPPYMNLRVFVGTATVQDSNAFLTAVNQPVTRFVSNSPKITYRIAGGDPGTSCVWFRMSVRSGVNNVIDARQMPPLASEEVDDAGLSTIGTWIATLPPPADL